MYDMAKQNRIKGWEVFMKKKLLVLILVVIIILSCITFYYVTKVSKGYDVNKIGSSIEVTGELIKDNEYRFHTNIQLSEKGPISSSILELSIYTQVELDKNTDKYILKSPKLEIIPIACEQYDKQQEYLTAMEYSANYQFGVKAYQSFKETMKVGSAKLLSNNKNIQINGIEETDSHSKINTVSSLRRATDNNADVVIDYNTLEQYFSQWYSVKFNLISDKKGVFNIY